MALILDVTLPFGRYSATPWGRHVNEGAVEWPPSPWRIVRALAASWHIHHPGLAADEVRSALEVLCAPPAYHLPRHVTSTTRHYLPDANDKKAKRSTDLALNPFVAVSPGEKMRVVWEAPHTDAQLSTLARLAGTVFYLGRAESRVTLEVSEADEAPPGGLIAMSGDEVEGQSTLDLLVPMVPLDWDAIHATSGRLHKDGLTAPPSTRWITFRTPDPEFRRGKGPDRPTPAPVQIMQFALSGRGRPSMANAALLSAFFRRAVTSRAQDDPSLHGHTPGDGSVRRPREDDHRHAHYLVLNDLASGRQIDRLVIWVPEGIPPAAVSRLAELASLRIPEHLQRRLGATVEVALEQVGPPANLDPRLVGTTTHWRTLTPVTTARHRKNRQTAGEFLQGVVRRELSHRGFPSSDFEVSVDQVPDADVAGPLQARRMYRARRLGRERQHTGFHVALTFTEPVRGPLALGSLAHFGLGTFVHADVGVGSRDR